MSRRALVVTHTESEGPGLLASWFAEEGLALEVVSPWRGEVLPSSLDGFSALVVMGGPQAAYDGSLPWELETLGLLRSGVSSALPTLGICLGAQLLAVACGGTVAPGDVGPEVGAKLVGKRDVAGNDLIFWDLPLSPLVVQWHWDAITALPPGATQLMAGTFYEHQAFRVGDRAWGLQFHVEAPPDLVVRWAAADREALEADAVDVDKVLAGVVEHHAEISEVWGEVMRRFARLAV